MRYLRKTDVGMIGFTLVDGNARIVEFGMSVPLPGKFDTPEEVVIAYNRQIAETEANFHKANQCACHAESHDDWEKPLTY
jgi:hypothetical protein